MTFFPFKGVAIEVPDKNSPPSSVSKILSAVRLAGISLPVIDAADIHTKIDTLGSESVLIIAQPIPTN